MFSLFQKKMAPTTGTSVSDNYYYPEACLKACADTKLFNTFRRNPLYNEIVEHVSKELGEQYLQELKKHNNYIDIIAEAKANDLYGDPHRYNYDGFGLLSPTTIRYAKVFADLRTSFGSLENLRICEIGVGYGGQCRIIGALERPLKYTLVDIRPALSLAEKYLDKYALRTTLDFQTMNCLEKAEYDLVISNYAFTELPRHIQEIYFEKIITGSSSGYITYNNINPSHFNSFSVLDLKNMIGGLKVLPEQPLTHSSNCILQWQSSAL
jgi:hypothetical protein